MRLVGRGAGLLSLAFVSSALVNVVPQAFFARAAPAHKAAWLAAALLLGTLGAMGGIAAARRLGFGRRPRLVGTALPLATGALLLAALRAPSAPLHLLLCVATRATATYGAQELDRRAVALAGAEARRANDRVGLALRFAGMLLGPLWFAAPRAATPALVAGLMGAAAGSAWLLRGAPPPDPPARGAALDPADRPVVWAARLIYGAYFLLASSLVYVLADLQGRPDAVARGGLLITIVYGAAIAATLAPWAGRRSLRGMLPAAGALVGAGLAAPVATGDVAVFGGAVGLGAAFALFQLAFRDHVTRRAVHQGRTGLVAAFNDLGNTSALVGFGAMAALTALARALDVAPASALLAGVAALGAASVPVLVRGVRVAAA